MIFAVALSGAACNFFTYKVGMGVGNGVGGGLVMISTSTEETTTSTLSAVPRLDAKEADDRSADTPAASASVDVYKGKSSGPTIKVKETDQTALPNKRFVE